MEVQNMGFYKWKPSKTAIREFKEKMDVIGDFCRANGISQSSTSDSYYFTLNGVDYRVSNHTIEASDRGMYDQNGNKIRGSYHSNDKDLVCITASKTRLIEIYNDLKSGYQLDKRGYRK